MCEVYSQSISEWFVVKFERPDNCCSPSTHAVLRVCVDHVRTMLLPCLLSSLALAASYPLRSALQLYSSSRCHSALSTGLPACPCVYPVLQNGDGLCVYLFTAWMNVCVNVYKCGCVPFRLLTLHLSAEWDQNLSLFTGESCWILSPLGYCFSKHS